MAEEELQVFGFWASPFSSRVELLLKLKGIDYKYIEEDVINNKSDLLLKYNPIYKKVPVLVHHDKPIAESLVILEYIDENWRDNHTIFPQDLHQRALDRFWAKYIDDKILLAVLKAARSKGEEREKAVEEAGEILKALEKELESYKLFFGGDKIGFVDIVGILVAYWVPAVEEGFGFELLRSNKFPNISKWSEELVNHNVVKQILPPRDKLVECLQRVL